MTAKAGDEPNKDIDQSGLPEKFKRLAEERQRLDLEQAQLLEQLASEHFVLAKLRALLDVAPAPAAQPPVADPPTPEPPIADPPTPEPPTADPPTKKLKVTPENVQRVYGIGDKGKDMLSHAEAESDLKLWAQIMNSNVNKCGKLFLGDTYRVEESTIELMHICTSLLVGWLGNYGSAADKYEDHRTLKRLLATLRACKHIYKRLTTK